MFPLRPNGSRIVTLASPHRQTPAPDAQSMAQRRRDILALVEERGKVSTDELAERFATSAVTIRTDLKVLSEAGAVVRTHGGALARRENEDLPIDVKEGLRHTEKARIAAVAAAMIQDGETVMLDSGSTTNAIARRILGLPLAGINVITNALNVATTLAPAANVRLVMLGGVLRPDSFSLSGPQAEAALAGFTADRLFLGVDSLDPEVGLMTPHLLEAQLNARMIRVSRHVVAVADASKLMRRHLSVIARVEAIHTLVTDDKAPPEVVAALQARGVEVILA